MSHTSNRMIYVSVIIPCYNCEKTIHECIESILHQTYKYIEIVVINDGSTDNTLKILEQASYYHPSIKVLSQTNQGIAAALNYGISKSKGSLVARIDADDIAHPEWVESQVLYMNHNKVVDIASCASINFVRKDKCKLFENKRIHPSSSRIIACMLTVCCPVSHPGTVCKSSVFKKISYSSQFYAEDHALWLSALEAGYIISNNPKTLIFYNVNSKSSLSVKNKYKMRLEKIFLSLYFFKTISHVLNFNRNIAKSVIHYLPTSFNKLHFRILAVLSKLCI